MLLSSVAKDEAFLWTIRVAKCVKLLPTWNVKISLLHLGPNKAILMITNNFKLAGTCQSNQPQEKICRRKKQALILTFSRKEELQRRRGEEGKGMGRNRNQVRPSVWLDGAITAIIFRSIDAKKLLEWEHFKNFYIFHVIFTSVFRESRIMWFASKTRSICEDKNEQRNGPNMFFGFLLLLCDMLFNKFSIT